MAARIRNDNWKDDETLKEDLEKYARSNLTRKEILDFMNRDHGEYAWSLRTLDRRLAFFDIRRIDKNVTVEEIRAAVENEVNGPGKLLGYRAMYNKIRQDYNLKVPRNLVHAVMFDVDPDGLEARNPNARWERRPKGNYTTKGTNFVHSMDGHDKLMGYQNSTFPLAIYGAIDTASRKILWLRIWDSNSDPKRIGRWYLEYLYEKKRIATMIRIDKGTETGIMATIHSFLRQHHGDMAPYDTVLYGPSTSNQIERWWKELHERMEKYFKVQLSMLKNDGDYDPDNELHRKLLSFILIPVVQRELDDFKKIVWNSHRIRHQKDTLLPDGIPDHIHAFPQEYGLEECGFHVTEDQLAEVAQHSGVLDLENDFLSPEMRQQCETIIPYPEKIESSDCAKAFLYLKRRYSEES
ncbi:uncharacterized protein LOC114541051 [Dendronephthya gigantea]|uniref:uncharacterized protein LOC114535940 n=1 Tax=Dendronephthya gigantea TaxID=151771 RepID=UPI00106930FB|nr:uncharacterized protein LOC114535940 [Dendronephthya gigantea]XP_028416845.1 uncharacterized protein LOC114541051 [Dendronephthya gigantea]